MSDPDFDALRAARNADAHERLARMATKLGVPLGELRTSFNPDACYCACGTGGPCEHKWDGGPYESEDGRIWSTTCSRCGMTSVSHDVSCAP